MREAKLFWGGVQKIAYPRKKRTEEKRGGEENGTEVRDRIYRDFSVLNLWSFLVNSIYFNRLWDRYYYICLHMCKNTYLCVCVFACAYVSIHYLESWRWWGGRAVFSIRFFQLFVWRCFHKTYAMIFVCIFNLLFF